MAIESFLATYEDATTYLRSVKPKKLRVQVAEVARKREMKNNTDQMMEAQMMIKEMSAVKRMKVKVEMMMKAGARGARDAEKRDDNRDGEVFLGRVTAALEASPFDLA